MEAQSIQPPYQGQPQVFVLGIDDEGQYVIYTHTGESCLDQIYLTPTALKALNTYAEQNPI